MYLRLFLIRGLANRLKSLLTSFNIDPVALRLPKPWGKGGEAAILNYLLSLAYFKA